MLIDCDDKGWKLIVDTLISRVYKKPVSPDYIAGYCQARTDLRHALEHPDKF